MCYGDTLETMSLMYICGYRVQRIKRQRRISGIGQMGYGFRLEIIARATYNCIYSAYGLNVSMAGAIASLSQDCVPANNTTAPAFGLFTLAIAFDASRLS